MFSENKEDKCLDFIVAKEGNKPLILSPEKLKELVSKGEIKGDDLIFRENLKVWTKARYVKGLRSLIAKLETNNASVQESDEDLFDELIEHIDSEVILENGSSLSKEIIDTTKNMHLPPALASVVAARNVKNNFGAFPIPKKMSGNSISEMGCKSNFKIQYSNKKSINFSKITPFVNYFIIGLFLIVLCWNFYPDSVGSTQPYADFITGSVTFGGMPIKYGSIGAINLEGVEVYGIVDAKGTFCLKNPPKGQLKVRYIPFFPTMQESSLDKKDDKLKKRRTQGLNLASDMEVINIDYQSGKMVFNLNFKAK